MKDSVREKIAQELYAAWALKMGEATPTPWEKIDATEREAWLDVAVKAGDVFAGRSAVDGLVRRCFRLWALLLGPGHDVALVIKPRKGGGVMAHRFGDQAGVEGERIADALGGLLGTLEQTAKQNLAQLEESASQWRTVLEGKK